MFSVKNKPFHELRSVVAAQATQHVKEGITEPQPKAAIAVARGGQLGLSALQVDDIQLEITNLETELHELQQEWQEYKFNPPQIVGPSISLAMTVGILGVELLSLSYCFLAILEPGLFPILAALSSLYLLSTKVGGFIPESARAASQRLGLYLLIGLGLGAMRASGGMIRLGEPLPIALMTGLISGMLAAMMGLVSWYSIPALQGYFSEYWRYLMLQLNMKTTKKTLKTLKMQIHESQRIFNEDKALADVYNSTFEASTKALSRYREEFGSEENAEVAWYEYNGN